MFSFCNKRANSASPEAMRSVRKYDHWQEWSPARRVIPHPVLANFQPHGNVLRIEQRFVVILGIGRSIGHLISNKSKQGTVPREAIRSVGMCLGSNAAPSWNNPDSSCIGARHILYLSTLAASIAFTGNLSMNTSALERFVSILLHELGFER
jgi:hypothetical protein